MGAVVKGPNQHLHILLIGIESLLRGELTNSKNECKAISIIFEH